MKKTIKTLALALAFYATANTLQAQTIPNAGFENWSSMGAYEDPQGWATLNAMTNPMSVYTATKGTPGNVGSSYLKLVSKTITGMGVVPGIATSGTFDATTMKPASGFACNTRPEKLTGKWQHMIYGSSQGSATVVLTRWDATSSSRKEVATGAITLSGMAMSWASFTMTLNYTDNDHNPDSCMITFSASGSAPTDGDYLWVDALAFNGYVGLTGINDVKNNIFQTSVSPNPSNSNWNITAKAMDGNTTAKLYNTLGAEIEINKPQTDGNMMSLSISNAQLPAGIYFLKLQNGTLNQSVRLIKN